MASQMSAKQLNGKEHTDLGMKGREAKEKPRVVPDWK